MSEFEIWQAPFEQTGLSAFSGGYDPAFDYAQVWASTLNELGIVYLSGDEENDVLGMIYSAFQRVDEEHMPPEGYTGRSLSAGDLVRLDGRWFYCALEGWEEVER